jgi:hypothetical protein
MAGSSWRRQSLLSYSAAVTISTTNDRQLVRPGPSAANKALCLGRDGFGLTVRIVSLSMVRKRPPTPTHDAARCDEILV